MSTRVLSREERDRAIKEADAILRLGKKWQRLVPNERRPNFEAAAASILRHVTTSKVDSGRRRTLNIKEDGLQHHHDEREARLLERTLKVGTLPQEVLHSFQTGRVRRQPRKLQLDRGPDPAHLPGFELYMHDSTKDYHMPGHYNVRTGQYQNHMHSMHADFGGARLVPQLMPSVKVPGGTEELHM